MKTIFLVLVAAATFGTACGDSDPSPGNGASCTDACDVLVPCVGVSAAQCRSTCEATLLQRQIDCAATATSCAAANQCLEIREPPGDVSSEDTSAADISTEDTAPEDSSFSGCSFLGCDGNQVCVNSLADEDGTCRDTVQTCNEDMFPNVCNCLFDGVGESPEGHALCSKGVGSCEVRGGKLRVTCKS